MHKLLFGKQTGSIKTFVIILTYLVFYINDIIEHSNKLELYYQRLCYFKKNDLSNYDDYLRKL